MAQERVLNPDVAVTPVLGVSKLMVQAGGHHLLNIHLQMFYHKLFPFLFVFSLQEQAKFESLLKEGHGAGVR